jgi:hypothetical protein
VCSNNAVAFAAQKRCGEGRYQQLIFLRPKPQTNTRQKQWSEHNYFFS